MVRDVLYVSALCSNKLEQRMLMMAPKEVGIQIQKYHRLLATGFLKNNINTYALSYNRTANNIRNYPLNEKEDGIEYQYIKAKTNMMSHAEVILKSFLKSVDFLHKHNDMFVICDVLNLSVSIGAWAAAKLCKREFVGIITDFPEMVIASHKKKSIYWWLIRHCSSYVLLTEEMKKKVDVSKKRCVVLEGHVDYRMNDESHTKAKKWSGINCVYAGGLHKKYGISTLISAFVKSDIPNSVLHIYGDGDYANEIRKMNNKHIVYHGIVSNQDVVAAEQAATLLINPRPTNEEFTKFSFPSKNMEYMASGTPVLTTNLSGMPQEYYPYVYRFFDETVEGMSETLREVLGLPQSTLLAKGDQAKKFVLEKKNNVVQAEKIINMVENVQCGK